MPVMPAPTTSTSTPITSRGARASDSGSEEFMALELLYRPVSILRRGHGGREVVGAPRAVRDRAPRPRSQGALLRPRLLRDGSGAVLAAGLADGVPTRGDPEVGRLRRVRDPRSVGHRVARRRLEYGR